MARTTKWEHPSDSYRIGQRLERKARPAGRMSRWIEDELAAEGEET